MKNIEIKNYSFLFVLLVTIVSCKTNIDVREKELKQEEGLLSVVLNTNPNSNELSIKTINDTIFWNPKTFSFEELSCNFMKELFSKDTFVLSHSTESNNSSASGPDNAKRGEMYFINILTEKVLKIRFENEITLYPFKSWITQGTEKKAIIDVDFNNNVLVLLDGSKNELNYDLTEVLNFPINCE